MLVKFRVQHLGSGTAQPFGPNGAEIFPNNLLKRINQYRNCGCFFVEIKLICDDDPDPTEPCSLLTSEDLKRYLISNQGKSVLKHFDKKQKFTTTIRRKLVHILTELIRERYGDKNPKNSDIEMVCRAAVNLFPCLKVEPSKIGGIVSV